MIVKASKRLQIVLDIAVKEQEQAAEKLQQSRQMLNQEQQQLDQLVVYQQEYNQRFKEVQNNPTQLSNYLKFYNSLDLVINSQHEKISLAEKAVEQTMKNWRITYVKQENLKQLITKKTEEERALADKQQQKVLDEQSSQMFYRRRAKR